MKPTYRKSCAANLLMWSDLFKHILFTIGQQSYNYKKYSYTKSFCGQIDLGPLLQGQMRIAKLKCAYNSLIIGHRGFGMINQPIANHGLGIFWCGHI